MGRVAGLAPEETRQRVLDAAAAVFAECGFEGARMIEIARAAGLSVGAIYNHYASKAELLAAVVERHGVDDISRLLTGDTPTGVLDLIAKLGHELGRGQPAAPLLAEVILAGRRDAEVGRILLQEFAGREELMADFLRFGQSTGDVTPEIDPAVVARFCLMLGLGSLMIQALDLPGTDPVAWASFINRLVDGFRTEEDK